MVRPLALDPEELSVRRALRLYRRAVLLRCPHCGGGPIVASWFRMRPQCPECDIRMNRGEEDFFLGAMMFNLILAEGLLVAAGLLVVLLSWPAVPWDMLVNVGLVLMAVAPFVFYPFSHAIWLASDILIRPVTEAEMHWHREAPADAYRPQRDR